MMRASRYLPLTFDFYVTAYVPSSYVLPRERPRTLREMLDNEMVRSVKPVCERPGSTQEDVEKAEREAYRAMQMMLAES